MTFDDKLGDKASAREMWMKVLEDVEDKEALLRLIEDAVARNGASEAAGLFVVWSMRPRRSERATIALREAQLLANQLGDVPRAIARYEQIVSDFDPNCRPALQAIADLHEAAGRPSEAANALERELLLTTARDEHLAIARRLANLYEQIDDPGNAIRTLEVIRQFDPRDSEALARLCNLCERTNSGRNPRHSSPNASRAIGRTGSRALTYRLATILAEELGRGDEALSALTPLADANDPSIRAAYIELGDRLERTALVASKLVQWWLEAAPSEQRIDNLRDAFDRYASVDRDEDAVRVGARSYAAAAWTSSLRSGSKRSQ